MSKNVSNLLISKNDIYTKKEAFQLLCDAIALPRVPGRIKTIREALKLYQEASFEEAPLWKRIFRIK